jgi:hypothetical protein
VADYCGVKAPHRLAGTSLRPLLENPARQSKNAAFTLVVRGPGRYGQTVRTNRWRYTRWSDGAAELYDEQEDREETHNLVGSPLHAARVQELQKLLDTIGPLHPASFDGMKSARGKQ